MKRPLIIGITGSIASGKSELVSQLDKTELKVYSTDKIGHDVLFLEEVKNRLIDKFGSEIINPNNKLIDREKLSKLVFKDKSNLAFLNSISHPQIFKKMRELIINSQAKYIFFEVPLLFEAKLEKHFDFIITVSTTPENQLLRLMRRNNLTKDEALQKIASQLPNTHKETNSDYIIHNNGDLEELEQEVSMLMPILPSISPKDIIPF